MKWCLSCSSSGKQSFLHGAHSLLQLYVLRWCGLLLKEGKLFFCICHWWETRVAAGERWIMAFPSCLCGFPAKIVPWGWYAWGQLCCWCEGCGSCLLYPLRISWLLGFHQGGQHRMETMAGFLSGRLRFLKATEGIKIICYLHLKGVPIWHGPCWGIGKISALCWCQMIFAMNKCFPTAALYLMDLLRNREKGEKIISNKLTSQKMVFE